MIPSSQLCNESFPSHLPRWKAINGRVPVIDKFGLIASGFRSGQLVGHGPIFDVTNDGEVQFCDQPFATEASSTKIDFVILALGYQDQCIIDREDRIGGLYKCGFGKDRFLPLRSIFEEAKCIADDILKSHPH